MGNELPHSTNTLCVPECLYGGIKGTAKMVTCFQCMNLVHPECCGGVMEIDYVGPYSCSSCRKMYQRVIGLEKQMENMHMLNKELLVLLEKVIANVKV